MKDDELQFTVMIGRIVRSDLPGAPVLEPQFRELSFLDTIDGQCVACAKPAKVVTCELDSIERLVSTLAIKGFMKLPTTSSVLAGSCKRCDKVYHFNCVKAITMGGGTVFLCGSCRSELTVAAK